MNAPRDHAFYSGSQMPAFFRCLDRLNASRGVPPLPESKWATEGTLAHALLESWLKGESAPGEFMALPEAERENMSRAVKVAFDYVVEMTEGNPGSFVEVEKHFEIPGLPTNERAGGYNDINISIPMFGEKVILDYKHGVDPVEASSEQLYFYALGDYLNGGKAEGYHTYHLTIIQPRVIGRDPVQVHTVTADDLEFFYWLLKQAILIAESGSAPRTPGTKQCKYCPAFVGYCEAARDNALAVARTNFSQIAAARGALLPIPEPASMGFDEIARILPVLPQLKQWVKAVEERSVEYARAGHAIPGYKLVHSSARREFATDIYHEKSIAEWIASAAGVDLDSVYERQLPGITKAEQMVVSAARAAHKTKKAKDAAAQEMRKAFAQLTTKEPSSNVTLAPEYDERPAVNPASAFAQIKGAL